MAYDKPYYSITYAFPAVDFGGAANIDREFIGPPGLKGKVKAITLTGTEVFLGTTTAAAVNIGTAAGGTQKLALTIDSNGADAFQDGDVYVADCDAASANSVGAPGNTITVTTNDLAADTAWYVRFVACVGGTVTGIADVYITVDWGNW